MRIRRYEAPTIQEALMKVKKDLGPEAVILYTKTFRKGGVLGMFGRPMAEITAGVDLNLLDDVAKRKATTAVAAPVVERGELPLPKPSPGTATGHSSSSPMGSYDPARAKVKALQRELNEMKTSSVATAIRDLNQVDAGALLSEGFNRIKKKMMKQEVEDFLIQKMIRGMISERIDPEKNEEVFNWVNRFV